MYAFLADITMTKIKNIPKFWIIGGDSIKNIKLDIFVNSGNYRNTNVFNLIKKNHK